MEWQEQVAAIRTAGRAVGGEERIDKVSEFAGCPASPLPGSPLVHLMVETDHKRLTSREPLLYGFARCGYWGRLDMQRRTFMTATSLAIGAIAATYRWPRAWASAAPLAPKVRTGLIIPLSDIDVAKDRATLVWGDVVRIEGTVRTGGHPLNIIARQIEFLANARIDSQGPAASPSYPRGSSASVGPSAGDNGRGGDNGGPGAHAGDVLLVADSILGEIDIAASGGDGGDAQSGGEGAKGSAGQPQRVECRDGPRGGSGGRGGLAGRPGVGGNGGNVKIYSRLRNDERPDIAVAAGEPGDPAQHGHPGEGGPGGRGGPEKREYERPDTRPDIFD